MRPNILHIFTDQQRFDTIAALGNPVIKTPNLDRLVKSGVAFTNAFSPSPVCVPARCSMIYGQYPCTTGCAANSVPMPQAPKTFMDRLADSGYLTHGIGKCHFTPNARALRGFKAREFQEEMPSAIEPTDYYTMLKNSPWAYAYEAQGTRGPMYYLPSTSKLPQEMHPTQWIGDRTVAFLEEQKDNTDTPWYCFSSFVHPHPPFTPPVPWHKLYPAAQMPLPNVPVDYEKLQMFVNKMQNRRKYRDHGIDVNLVRAIKSYYYACISFVDYQVGRMLDTLEATGQLENTLILFTTDHGELLGDYNCFGKRSMHDSCARIPFIMSWPGKLEAGTTCSTPISLVDIAPTFLAAAGVPENDANFDGVDLFKLMKGEISRDAVYSMKSYSGLPKFLGHTPEEYIGVEVKDNKYHEDRIGSLNGIIGTYPKEYDGIEAQACASYMIVTEQYKYVYSVPDNREFLFDKVRDPRETNNCAGMVLYKPIQAELRTRLVNYLKDHEIDGIFDGDNFKKLPELKMPDALDCGLLQQEVKVDWFDDRLPGYNC